eukprot:13232-Heterococcus_DN1.PRE.3
MLLTQHSPGTSSGLSLSDTPLSLTASVEYAPSSFTPAVLTGSIGAKRDISSADVNSDNYTLRMIVDGLKLMLQVSCSTIETYLLPTAQVSRLLVATLSDKARCCRHRQPPLLAAVTYTASSGD